MRKLHDFRRALLTCSLLLAVGVTLMSAAVATASNTPYSQAVLGDSPLGYWPLDGSSLTSAADASGHGYTLTGPGTGLTAGVTGPMAGAGAMSFSGGYLGRAYFAYPNNFAMEFWVRSNGVVERQAPVSNGWVGTDNCWHGVWAGAHANYVFGYNANTCSLGGSTPYFDVFSSQSDWHHMVVQRSAGVTSVWIDGVEQPGTTNTTVTLNGGSFRIGGLQNGSASQSFGPFSGALSEVAYYNHVLTGAQLAAHYNAAVGAPTNTALPTVAPAALLGPGLLLSAKPGTWVGAGMTYAYQWRRCDASGATCADISGATSSTYTLQGADAGATIRVQVTATDSAGTATESSSATEVVAAQTPFAHPLYSQTVLGDSPLGYWPLDGSPLTSAADVSGNGNTLTGPGTGLTAGVTGPMAGAKGMSFTNGYLGRGYFAYTNNFAMEFWARSNRVNERQAPVSNGWVGTDNCWHGVWAGVQASVLFGYDANTCSQGGSTTNLSLFSSQSDWHHVVVQRSAGVTSLWADGVQQSVTDSTTVTLNGGSFRVGGLHNGSASQSFGPFSGAISDVAYYNHVLTGARIAEHYNTAVGIPTNTAPPTIAPASSLGPGLLLSAKPGTWVGAGMTYAYQWRRCDASGATCADISGATSSTYTLQGADAGATIRVRVTATDSAGTATESSSATDVVAAQTPHAHPLYSQTVLGDSPLGYWPLDGTSLTSAGDASGNGNTLTGPGTGLTAGVAGPMAGAKGMTFSGGYLGRGYFAYTNNFAMEFWARSNRVNERQAPVSNGWVGTDNCWHGVWAGAQASILFGYNANTCFMGGSTTNFSLFSSQSDWHHVVVQRSAGVTSLWTDGVQQPGTNSTTVTLNGGSFRVGGLQNGSASESFGPFYGAISDVAYYSHVLTGPQITAHHDAAVGIPTNTTPPTISPTTGLHDSDTVTADHGTWAGAGTITYAYQWQACTSPSSCSPISGATAATYQLTAAEVDKTIKVVVTATSALGSGSATSAATADVASTKPSNTAAPSISGEATEGEELTSTTGTWSGGEPITYSWQWLRCDTDGEDCSPITDETGETYTLTSADVSATIRVKVTATNGAGSETATSAETDPVAGRAPDNTVLPSIDGAAAEGSLLTATSGTWDGTEPITYAYRWRRCAGSGGSCVDIAGATSDTYTLATADVGAAIRVVVTATNAAGEESATSAATDPVAGAVEAPQLPIHETTDVGDASEFLYTGENPIQEGVEPETIVGERAAVIRGRVLDTDGVPLAGVTVGVVDHPELGSMTTTGDGQVYLAVNGGGTLRVRYERDGYLPVERDVEVPWQNWAWAEDVRLTELDSHVTDVDLSSPLSVAQIARGSVENDDSGSRQATLLFPAGTTATMTVDGGTELPLSHLNVRATEYTVGDHGEDAMPASLPAASAYTYAVDYSVDEALAAGASQVSFSQPVITYTDDFVGFETGTTVPVGYYDKEQGAWVPTPDGRVIEILSETGGAADIDTDGDGDADSAPELALLGITADERTSLADLYAPGKRLWRVAVSHFSVFDYNWGIGFSGGGWRTPGVRGTGFGPMDGSCSSGGSIIGCDDQTLGEDLALTGTGTSLHYRSDRTPGRVVGNTLQMTVTPDEPGALIRALVTIDVAGQQIKRQFDADPSQVYNYTWDGKDSFGRTVTGAVDANVQVDYVYPTVYRAKVPEAGGPTFGLPGGTSTAIPTRGEGTTTTAFSVKIGGVKTAPDDLGGWTLSGHNSYDPAGKILHLGDGEQVSGQELGTPISHFAGDGGSIASRGTAGRSGGDYGDGGPARLADIENLRAGAAGPDGSVYLVDGGHHRVRRVGPDGIIETVAGGGEPPEEGQGPDTGDGGPATDAWLGNPGAVALGTDGSLYIADGYRVRKVAPDGTIDTVAGTGDDGAPSGDGGPATSAVLGAGDGIAVATDGTLYVADGDHHVVRRIGPDGTISTFAGTGVAGFSGDDGPATAAKLGSLGGLAVAPDGALSIADAGNNRVRRVTRDGVIDTVAGNGVGASSGDGLQATSAAINGPSGLATGADGTLYVTENGKVRIIRPDGKISTFAGGGSGSAMGGGAASAANLACPTAVMTGPGESVYINDSCSARAFRVGPARPGAGQDTYRIPAPDGSVVYTFDRHGRHLKTVNARTGADTATMAYDSAGRLLSMTDGDGNVTAVERASAGYPTAIVAPFGQRTELTRDSNGWLAGVEDPGGHAFTMTSTSRGLLRSLTSPRGFTSHFDYDAVGYLTSDSDAAGGSKELVRTDHEGGANVVMTTAGGKATTYGTTRDGFDTTTRSFTDPSGLAGGTANDGNAILNRTLPDGTTLTNKRTADPRFGLGAPLISGSVTTPGGVNYLATSTKSVELSDPDDLMSLDSSDDAAEINGQTWLQHYDGSSAESTTTSPEGREVTSTADDQDRPLDVDVPGVLTVTSEYDSHGRLASTEQGSRSTTYYYGVDGFVSQVDAPLGQSTSYDYDPAGRLLSTVLPGSRTINYTYDDNGNVASLAPPGKPAYEFTSTAIDLPETVTAPDVGDGATPTHYHYNTDRQITALDRPDGSTLGYHYDTGGRLSSLTSGGDTIDYDYDAGSGQVTSIGAPSGETLSFGYDGGLSTSDTLSGDVAGTVTRTFDDDMRVARVAVTGADPIDYSYDNDGLLTQLGDLTVTHAPSNGFASATSIGAVTTAIGWSTYGELSSASAAISGTPAFTDSYTRDPFGRISAKTEAVAGTTVTEDYAYAPAGWLTDVTRDGDPVAHYAYDLNGNRTSVTTPAGTRTAVYDDQDRILSDGDTTYTYNKNGQRTTKTEDDDQTDYAYNAFDALDRVDLPDGRQIDYVLDGQNRRVGKKVDGDLTQGFLYGKALNPEAEIAANGSLRSVFVYGSDSATPSLMIRGGTTYRFITDDRASPRLIVNATTGAVVQRLNYDAYGNITEDTNPGFQPFGFQGGIYDADTGLTRFGQRDYDPQIGRFTTKDPKGFAGGPTNLYMFSANDPINGADPTGNGLFDFATDFLGGLAGDAAGAVSAVGNTAAAAFNAAPNLAAGTLDGLTGGLSTQIAGSVFGFNPSCADFGTAGRIGQGLGMAASFFTGSGEATLLGRAAKGEGALTRAWNDFGAPGVDDALHFAKSTGARHTDDQAALVQLAKEAKRRGGLTEEEGKTMVGWGDEVGLPARGPEAHPDRGGPSALPHYHIGPIGHIPTR
jgi:RHS repeat-associated protein